jgi:phosphate:Na+ symporter
VAWGHTVFNVLGVCYILPLLWLKVFAPVVMWVTPGEVTQATIMLHIAVAHSMFNVFNTLVFLPLIGLIEKLLLKVMPVTVEEAEQQPVVLEERLLDTPVIALSQAKRELIRMAREAKRAVESATSGLMSGDVKKLEKTRKTEDLIDEFQLEITSYLVELSERQLGDEVSVELPVLLHIVNDLERVGDHAVNIVEIAERKIEQKIVFGETATKESKELVVEVITMLDRVIVAMENTDVQSAHKALGNENRLNKMQVNFRRSHVQRMTDGTCSAAAGLIFIDLVDNVEKIGDHLTNIAQSVIGGVQWYGVDSSTLSGEYDTMG